MNSTRREVMMFSVIIRDSSPITFESLLYDLVNRNVGEEAQNIFLREFLDLSLEVLSPLALSPQLDFSTSAKLGLIAEYNSRISNNSF